MAGSTIQGSGPTIHCSSGKPRCIITIGNTPLQVQCMCTRMNGIVPYAYNQLSTEKLCPERRRHATVCRCEKPEGPYKLQHSTSARHQCCLLLQPLRGQEQYNAQTSRLCPIRPLSVCVRADQSRSKKSILARITPLSRACSRSAL